MPIQRLFHLNKRFNERVECLGRLGKARVEVDAWRSRVDLGLRVEPGRLRKAGQEGLQLGQVVDGSAGFCPDFAVGVFGGHGVLHTGFVLRSPRQTT